MFLLIRKEVVMKRKLKQEPITLYVPEWLNEALNDFALREKRTKSNLIKAILINEINNKITKIRRAS